MNIHQNRISGCHSALDEVFLTQVVNFVKLTETCYLAGRNALFTPFPFALLIIPIRDAFLQKNAIHLENRCLPSRGYDCCISEMFFGQACKKAMFFRDKAPGFFCLNLLEQLHANTVHLGSMQKRSLPRAFLFERDRSSMEGIMTGFAQRQQIGFLIASVLTSENKVMHFKPLILRFALAMLAGVAVSCKDIRFGIGIPVVDPFLIQPLVLKYLWIFEGMGIKGSCFQDHGRDRQQGLHKTDFPQMRVDFASDRG